ncbi:MAG: beta-ketoacyl synthase N-terminal-like domain-containing protein [Phycisphaerales bacterium]
MHQDAAIVITGIGLVSSLGKSPEETWSAVREGKRGLGPMTQIEQHARPDKGGGQAVDLPADFSPNLSRPSRYLRYAISQALATRGLPTPAQNRRAAVFGTTMHGMDAGGRFFRSGNPNELREFLAARVLDRALEGLGIGGPALTTCSACSSALSAVGIGMSLLRSGEFDLVVVGGYDCVSEYSYAGFDSLRLISSTAPMPFAADRDGMKVAEGYGVLVLERVSDAAPSGKMPLAHLAGFGESSDAFHLTQPHATGDGAAAAIRAAFRNSDLTPLDIEMIAAHGTSTPNNDAAEYAALAATFGEKLSRTPVVAFKSYLGHTLGGAGAVELILSIMARRDGFVPPTLGADQTDPKFSGLSVVRGTPLRRSIRTTMNMSLGFGGANTCAILSDKSPTRPNRSRENCDVVITGVGVVLPGAIGNHAFVELLRSTNRPALSRDTGPIAESDYAHLISSRRARRMSEYAKLTVAATAAACEDARAIKSDFLERASAILGTTHGAVGYCEEFYTQVVREGMGAANPVLFAEGVPNVAAAHLSMNFGIKGSCQTILGTRCAGLDALRLAALRIRQGQWDCALVSAAEEYAPVVNRAYEACGLYGGDTDQHPHRFVTGSGAVTFILESRKSAERRGARVRGILETGAWSAGSVGRGPVDEAWRAIGSPGFVVTAFGEIRPDKVMTSVSRGNTQVAETTKAWSAYGTIPEVFSVGPLASLAAVLLEAPIDGGKPLQNNQSFGVVASEFTGATTAIRVRMPSNSVIHASATAFSL